MLNAEAVKQAARDSGFGLVGLAAAQPLEPHPLRAWLAAGMHGAMRWMEERVDERLDPRRLQPGCRTVVALGACFLTTAHLRTSPIALYAQGRDYHATMRDRLRRFRRRLLELAPGIRTYSAVDTGPVLERAWAARAGLGWLGRNGMLTTPEHGSNVVLAAMLLDREVNRYDAPIASGCDGCDRCVEACPTGALGAPGVVDARRCLAHQTIEQATEPFAPGLRAHAGGTAFGCDLCQRACPWNQRDHVCHDERFLPREIASLSLEDLATLEPRRHLLLTQGTAVARARFDGLRRNALIALGASRARSAGAIARSLLADASPLVRDAARWALEQAGEGP
ncbi:MAG: tRNA epoxyqueuosine(34) reductase QueG [Myxococcales bacterium]|jgi:epoxyqueuosine reductase